MGFVARQRRHVARGCSRQIDSAKVQTFWSGSPASPVHDLHIWPMSTTEIALTAHLVMPSGHPGDRFLMDAAHELAHDFRIGHTTIQIEVSEDTPCALAPDDVV